MSLDIVGRSIFFQPVFDRFGMALHDAQFFKKLAGLGFMGTPIPEQYGGAGFDYISHAIVAEEIGRVDSSLRGTYSVQVSLVELALNKYGNEEQKKKYLPKLTSGE